MSSTSRVYRFADFTVDLGQQMLHQGGSIVALPSRAFDTLVYLIAHRDRCVPKDELIAAIWGRVVVTEDSLVHAISVLRRALGENSREPSFIQTVPRRGYRFIGEIREPQPSPAAPARAPDRSTVAAPPGSIPARPPLSATPARGRSSRRAGALALAGVTLAVLAGVAYELRRDPAAPATGASVQLYQPAPPGTDIASGGVLAPNGRYLAFVARERTSGDAQIWLRTLNSDELRRLADTDGASKPFWSPDSREIAFFADGTLYTIDLDGRQRRAVAPAFAAAGGTWAADGTILFADWSSGLFKVPAAGDGAVETVMSLDRGAKDIAYAWPQFFPDDRHFVYQIVSLDSSRSGVHVGNLETGQSVRLLGGESSAVLASPQFLLHVVNDMLIAEQLDAERFELTGRAVVVARGISKPSLAAENVVSASSGLLAFQDGVTHDELAWYARDGSELEALDIPMALFNPRISSDGSKLVGTGTVTTDPGLWLVSLEREEYVRLDTDAIGPVFAPDGRHVAFTSRDGSDVYVRSIDGAGHRQKLASSESVKILNDWSPEGAQLVYTEFDDETRLDLWAIDVRSGVATPLLETPHNETQARISPDGNWIAYASDESGTLQIYVARFPDFTDRHAISLDGGGQPQWRADQGEIYFLAPDKTLMAVRAEGADQPSFAAPRPLFRAAVPGDPSDARDFFAADASGRKFLITRSTGAAEGQAITIAVNWASGITQRLTERRPGSTAAAD